MPFVRFMSSKIEDVENRVESLDRTDTIDKNTVGLLKDKFERSDIQTNIETFH